MSTLSRKQFIQSSALLLASLAVGSSFNSRRNDPLLSFSTIGCPDWSFEQITDFAARHGYKGLEVRGLQRQMDLAKSPVFASEEARKKTAAAMKEKGLVFVGLGSSANLHLAEGAEREKQLDQALQFVDLAAQIGCPYIRVFPNNFPKEQDKATTLSLITSGLQQLGDYAEGKKVTVLMETHGDVVKIADLLSIMQAVKSPNVGLVWDVANMWTVTKEPPLEAYRQLKKYIRHTHIKDAKLVEGKLQYTLLGEGEVPVMEAIKALRKGGYKGYYSFEWEKLWHPEIAEPEVALAHYPTVMKEHFRKG